MLVVHLRDFSENDGEMSMANRTRNTPRRGFWGALAATLLSAVILLVSGGMAAARMNPDLVGRAVEAVRGVVGPAPVAAAENVFYQVADWVNRTRYQLTGAAPSWQWSAAGGADAEAPPETPAATDQAAESRPVGADLASTPSASIALSPASATSTPDSRPRPDTGAQNDVGQSVAHEDVPRRATRGVPAPTATPELLPAVPSIIPRPALAGEGIWQPLATAGQPPDAPPVLWQTVIRPDPERPYAQVGLVAMDLAQSDLHIVVGTQEPVSDAAGRGLRTGVIPAAMQAGQKLLAAWNGGFRATHGRYGMMTDGVTWLPPLDGMMTIAIGPDGRVTMGAWGRGVQAGGGWRAWRQNNPPLIENGQINPDVVKYASTIRWGASIDGAVFIWRSGLGMTRGGRWLIYAAGNSLSAETLTTALKAGGAWDAMQLDVNATWERFVTFADKLQVVQVAGRDTKLPVTAVKLIAQMAGGPAQFLTPWDRDFFYLTYRAPAAPRPAERGRGAE